MTKYAALERVERPMALAGYRTRQVGRTLVRERGYLHVRPGGVTAETDLDVGVWVRERYLLPIEAPVAVPRAKARAVPVPEQMPVPVPEPVAAPAVEPVPEPVPEPVVAADPPKPEETQAVRTRGRFGKRNG